MAYNKNTGVDVKVKSSYEIYRSWIIILSFRDNLSNYIYIEKYLYVYFFSEGYI